MKEKETDYFNQLMNNEIEFNCFFDVKYAVKVIFDKVTDDCQFGSTSIASQRLLDMLTHAFPQLIYQVKSTDYENLVELVCAKNIEHHYTVFTDEPKFDLIDSISRFIWDKVFMEKENKNKNDEKCCINDLIIFSAYKNVTTIISKLIGKYKVLPPVKLTSLNNTSKMDSFLVDKNWMKSLIEFVNDLSDTTYGCYSFTDNSMIKYTTFKENKITSIHIDDMINVILPTLFNDYEEKNKQGGFNMSEALYAVVFTQQQHDTLMQLIDKGLLQPTNSFLIVKEPEEVKFVHLVDGKPRTDNQTTIMMFPVHVRIFYPTLDVEFFKSVAKLLSTIPANRKSSINESFSWDESGEKFIMKYYADGTEMLREMNLQQTFNCLLSQDWN